MTFELTILLLLAFFAFAILVLLLFLGLRLRARFSNLDRHLSQLNAHVSNEASRAVRQSQQSALEVQYANSLSQLAFRSPLFLGGWSIDAFLGKFLVNELLERPPRVLLELGGGSSTLLLARAAESLGLNQLRHIAVDHDARYLDLTRKLVTVNELAEKVDLWFCPLSPVEGSESRIWYENLIERLGGFEIDLLIVDGPPGDSQEKTRIPAMHLLRPFLSHSAVVILDDANRPQERAIATEWGRNNPDFSLEWEHAGHGFCVFRRNQSPD